MDTPEQNENNKSSFISRLWKGDIPLVRTFWIFWVIPPIAFPFIQGLLTFTLGPLLGALFLLIWFAFSLSFAVYQIICTKGLWSSATKYNGKKIWAIGAKLFVILGIVSSIYMIYEEVTAPKVDTHDPERMAEQMAIPSDEFPLAGFYKGKVTENFGFAIGPNKESGTYYISFCGPGGCFKPGTYLPNTTIIDDPNYEVIDNNTIKFKRSGNLVKRAPNNKR